eukprot:GHVN01042053.1.p2 GENE.GHVN01042053.1~~GHVN01042053.1.p2  ORF type:complete len:395 (+),score=51.18 GHVN01042053.1:1732-2916(+)
MTVDSMSTLGVRHREFRCGERMRRIERCSRVHRSTNSTSREGDSHDETNCDVVTTRQKRKRTPPFTPQSSEEDNRQTSAGGTPDGDDCNPYLKTYSNSLRRGQHGRTGGGGSRSEAYEERRGGRGAKTGEVRSSPTSQVTALVAAYTVWCRTKATMNTKQANITSSTNRRMERKLAKEATVDSRDTAGNAAHVGGESGEEESREETAGELLSTDFSTPMDMHPYQSYRKIKCSRTHSLGDREGRLGTAQWRQAENKLPCRQWWALLPPFSQDEGKFLVNYAGITDGGFWDSSGEYSQPSARGTDCRRRENDYGHLAGTQWVELPVDRPRPGPESKSSRRSSQSETDLTDEPCFGSEGGVMSLDLGFNSYESSGIGEVCPFPDRQSLNKKEFVSC